jgi:hypothetical protein
MPAKPATTDFQIQPLTCVRPANISQAQSLVTNPRGREAAVAGSAV